MSLILSGDNGVSDIDGSASTPAIRGTDANTGIFFPAADTIAFSEGGAEAMRINSSGNVGIGTTSPSSILHIASSSQPTFKILYTAQREYGLTVTGSAPTDGLAIRDESDSAEIARFCRSGNVGIGTSSPGYKLDLKAGTGSLSIANFASGDGTAANNVGAALFGTSSATQATRVISLYLDPNGADYGGTDFGILRYTGPGDYQIRNTKSDGTVTFYTNDTERARITSGGEFLVGKTTTSFSTAGVIIYPSGLIDLTRSGSPPLALNRTSNDGNLVEFYQDGTLEGNISVSGNTVSYNGFSGGHWTQLQQGRGYNPEIPRGTVMSSIGEMAEWKSVVWDEVIEHPAIPAVEAVEGKEAVLDEEGNVIEPAVEAVAAVEGKDAWTETIQRREAYIGDLPVGATFEEDGVTKTVVDDGNERLPKVKISDVVGDKAVYGVFQTYDEVQDMLVTALGAFVVRIAANVTVQIGDLLESNGDGCAKVQDDDVIRSKTIGKVTSTVKTATYADGSYTVPCVLYCG